MGAFHAYDIRGIYNQDFNKEDVYKIGYFLPELLKTNKILIGRDVRDSSPEIFEFLCKGITESGADVYNAGLTTTPMIYWATANYNFEASVMITASHNPKEYNGMKFSGKNAIPIGYDSGLKELENLVKLNSKIEILKNIGKITEINIEEEYLKFLYKYQSDYSNLNLTIDCSNGMAALIAKKVLGENHHFIFETLDGTFPNHEPNPLDEKNLVDLKKNVQKNKSDLGIIFDGDADRVMFVDENSNFIPPDLMIAVMGHFFLTEKDKTHYVIQDIRSSRSIQEYLEPMGAKIYTWRVGRAFAARKLREINGLYGGELAGHYYFKDFFFSDSAFLACLVILNVFAQMKNKGVSVSELITKIKKWENSGELNFKINKKDEAINAITKKYLALNPVRVLDFDGYRIEFENWWFNIRKSNTEPYLRLLIEAKDKNTLEEKKNEIISLLNPYS